MNISHLITIACFTALLSTNAQAQFSVSGSGSNIPMSGTGGGGTLPHTMPSSPGMSSVTVTTPVTSIDSIIIHDLSHTYVGDLQATLADPLGVEHLIWIQPGISGDFTGGIYTFVESTGVAMPSNSDIPAGTYNQSFQDPQAGSPWNSGDAGVFNTPLSTITGPSGSWTLKIYDWFPGDTGSFTSWTLNGNGAGLGSNTGDSYCFGDGTGATCPCSAFGASGEGCLNTSGSGATLTGLGDAFIGSSTFMLDVTGAPSNKPGIFFQGNLLANVPVGDGILCSNAAKRYPVLFTDVNGYASISVPDVDVSAGETMNYQFWFRDAGNSCSGAGFNLSNGWAVTWL